VDLFLIWKIASHSGPVRPETDLAILGTNALLRGLDHIGLLRLSCTEQKIMYSLSQHYAGLAELKIACTSNPPSPCDTPVDIGPRHWIEPAAHHAHIMAMRWLPGRGMHHSA